jgi:Lipocalin-like domain
MSKAAAILCAAVAAAPMGMGSASGQSSQGDAKRFVGAWRYVGTTIDGKPRPGRGANPKGVIFYTEGGHMAAQIAPDRKIKQAGSEPTPEEAKAALAEYIAYFGTYTVDQRARTVTHHREGSVQPDGLADYVRNYEFVGERLILRPINTRQEVVWERIK